jgi:uncharacterized protein
MKGAVFVLCGVLWLGFTFPVQAASFDCAKARTAAEKMICADAELSKLDERMAAAYAKTLARTKDKGKLKREQKEWLTRRDKCAKIVEDPEYYKDCIEKEYSNCTQTTKDTESCMKRARAKCAKIVKDRATEGSKSRMKRAYSEALFYLQPDKFSIIYSRNAAICGRFADMLNDDLKKLGKIDLSRHKEFNSIEFKQIQNAGTSGRGNIFISWFDINNDGTDEAVFKWEPMHKDFIFSDISYTSKQDGITIEYSIDKNLKKDSDGGYFYNKKSGDMRLGKDRIHDGTGGFNFTDSLGNLLFYGIHKNNYINIYGGGVNDPEPYPIVINGKYFLAVFGVIEAIFRDNCTPLRDGNIVALTAYNPSNHRDDICVLTRPNQHTKNCFYPAE